jgi:hypothetical protein
METQIVVHLGVALNRPELRFSEVLVPWIMIVGALGFVVAWLVVAIMEHTGLSGIFHFSSSGWSF